MNLRRTDRKGAEKTNYESHIARVRQAKTLVDCQAPQPHPIANKVDIEKRKKHALIEYGNKLLLGRISSIIQTKTIDNEIGEVTVVHSTSNRAITKSRKKVAMQKIILENKRILRRIQEVPPAYNHTEWDEHARVTEKHRKSISIFPDQIERIGSHTLSGKDSMSGTWTARIATTEFSTMASNVPKSPQAQIRGAGTGAGAPAGGGAAPAFGFSVYGPLRTISPAGRERGRSSSSDGTLPHLQTRKSIQN